jgi:YidC/Oxa1 family membrane protein insertase
VIDKLSQNTRLLIACILSATIIFVWQLFFVDPMLEEMKTDQARIELAAKTEPKKEEKLLNRDDIIREDFKNGTRIKIENPDLSGSINLIGARIDDLVMNKYNLSLNNSSEKVQLFSPSKSTIGYFAEFGFDGIDTKYLPNESTIWKADRNELKAGEPLTLTYTNATGVVFKIKITLDEKYLFTVEQSVTNNSGKELDISNFGFINRIDIPNTESNMIFHEGFIGYGGDALVEKTFSDILSEKQHEYGQARWFGFTDKYWLSSIIQDEQAYKTNITYSSASQKGLVKRMQTGFINKERISVAPNNTFNFPTLHLFAGAKELDVVEQYQSQLNLPLFDRVVDFGILYFITKPLYYFLSFLYQYLGNFGLAILALTLIIKVLLFPLAYKGIIGMNKLKDLQPKIQALKEKYEGNASEFQKQMIELYRKEKINPMGGCFPILLQIPVFFALYKVLYIAIEMRHAPFYFWIKDLSAPDPLSVFNLFGYLPWDPPSFLMIGILPILMSLSMYIQQRLSPEPTDPAQAQIMRLMPLMLLFMFAAFPSGLIIYWTFSNILSIIQQLLIKKLEGSK